LLAAGFADGDINVWELETFEHVLNFNGHSSGVTSLSFSDNNDYLISGS